MRNNSENRARAFVHDHEYVARGDSITPEFVLELHFEGLLDSYIEIVGSIASKLRQADLRSTSLSRARQLIPGLVLASMQSPFFTSHVLQKSAENDPMTFMANLEAALADKATRKNLATMVPSRSSYPRDGEYAAIQALLDHPCSDSRGPVIDSVEWSADKAAVTERIAADVKFRAKVIDEILEADPSFGDSMFSRLREKADVGMSAHEAEGYFDPEEFEGGRRQKLTVSEARRRVMAHTGQSERSIIRETKGWTADKIIALIA